MCVRYSFSFEMGFPSDPLFHTKLHDKYIFTHLPTQLKRQINILRNKIGMDVAPKYIRY